MNKSINDEGVYRTALATPGLLKRLVVLNMCPLYLSVVIFQRSNFKVYQLRKLNLSRKFSLTIQGLRTTALPSLQVNTLAIIKCKDIYSHHSHTQFIFLSTAWQSWHQFVLHFNYLYIQFYTLFSLFSILRLLSILSLFNILSLLSLFSLISLFKYVQSVLPI